MNTPWRLMTRDERVAWTIGHWRALVPAITTLAAIALMSLPLFAPVPVLPHLPFLAVAAWTLFVPELMRPWTAFALGILTDAMLGLPLGVNATLLPVLSLSLSAFERRFGHLPFLAEWALVAIASLLYFFLSWELLSFVRGDLPFAPLLFQAGTTALAYPLAALACAHVQHGWVDAG